MTSADNAFVALRRRLFAGSARPGRNRLPASGHVRMVLRAMCLVALACTALLATTGCDEQTSGTFTAKLGDEWFTLETALDPATQARGLGGRTEIPENGGMIFVGDIDERKSFWMKDCLIDMDIIFVDRAGYIDSVYTMKAVPLRQPNETEADYERRLRDTASYESIGRVRYVIEIRAGKARELGLKRGDKLPLDLNRLKELEAAADGQ